MAHRPPSRASCAAAGVTRPRPGHADLVGVLKYPTGWTPGDILERAPAPRRDHGPRGRRRPRPAAAGRSGVEIGSHVVSPRGVTAARTRHPPHAAQRGLRPLRGPGCSTRRSRRRSSAASMPPRGRRHPRRRGGGRGPRSGGGAREPRELGPEARTAASPGCSCPFPRWKAVEIGMGVEAARRPRIRGARHHRPGRRAPTPARRGRHAGRLPAPQQQRRRPGGGMTTGEPISFGWR